MRNDQEPLEEPPYAAEERKRAKRRKKDDLKSHKDIVLVQVFLGVAVIVLLTMFFKGIFTDGGRKAPEVITEIVPPELE